MAIKKVKVSDLPDAQDFGGLYTLGLKVSDQVDEFGKPIEVKESVKVGLEFVKTAADAASNAAESANEASVTANSAAANANTATSAATQATAQAIETAEHPTYIGDDQYVYEWDSQSKKYVKTEIYVKGASGVYCGVEPTEYDDVWIDPDGDAATADDILAGNGESVQQNIDSMNLSLTAANKTIAEAVLKLPNTLPVAVTGTAAAPVYTFTKADFDTVAQSYANGAQIFVDITDSRTTTNKPIDLSARYDALWNKTLSQIEVRDTNVARGFYLDGTTPSSRGCLSNDTKKYVKAGAIFNPITGLYLLNEVTLLEDDISEIYTLSGSLVNNPSVQQFRGCTCKTLFPFRGWTKTNVGAFDRVYQLMGNGVNIRVFDTDGLPIVTSLTYCFSASTWMKILGSINVSGITTAAGMDSAFLNSDKLEVVSLKGLKVSVSFAQSANLTVESIMYIVNNSANTTPITITLHPTAMARLSPEDIALASSKNITLTA